MPVSHGSAFRYMYLHEAPAVIVLVMPVALLKRTERFPMALKVQPYTYQPSNNNMNAYAQRH